MRWLTLACLQVFLHVSSKWSGNLSVKEYVNPAEYATVLQDTIFAPCPRVSESDDRHLDHKTAASPLADNSLIIHLSGISQGHSADTYRFYEAIEAGAIPVLPLDHDARAHLPANYFDGPVVTVPSWQELWSVLKPLLADKAALDALQRATLAWYNRFMSSKQQQLESVIKQHA